MFYHYQIRPVLLVVPAWIPSLHLIKYMWGGPASLQKQHGGSLTLGTFHSKQRQLFSQASSHHKLPLSFSATTFHIFVAHFTVAFNNTFYYINTNEIPGELDIFNLAINFNILYYLLTKLSANHAILNFSPGDDYRFFKSGPVPKQ